MSASISENHVFYKLVSFQSSAMFFGSMQMGWWWHGEGGEDVGPFSLMGWGKLSLFDSPFSLPLTLTSTLTKAPNHPFLALGVDASLRGGRGLE